MKFLFEVIIRDVVNDYLWINDVSFSFLYYIQNNIKIINKHFYITSIIILNKK